MRYLRLLSLWRVDERVNDLVELRYGASPPVKQKNRDRVLMRAFLVDEMDPKDTFYLMEPMVARCRYSRCILDINKVLIEAASQVEGSK